MQQEVGPGALSGDRVPGPTHQERETVKGCIEIRREGFASYVIVKERDERGYPYVDIVSVCVTKRGAIHRAKREMRKAPDKKWSEYRFIWRKCP